jgi:hypothetical protein
LPCVCVWPFSYRIFSVMYYYAFFQLRVSGSRLLFEASCAVGG